MPRSAGLTDLVPVAVGVVKNSKGEILVAGRLNQELVWEFPGGKFEPGETVLQALARELQEEIGITVLAATPLFEFTHHYDHVSVRLHVCHVTEFQGIARGLEGQPIQWVSLAALGELPMLPANRYILDKLL